MERVDEVVHAFILSRTKIKDPQDLLLVPKTRSPRKHKILTFIMDIRMCPAAAALPAGVPVCQTKLFVELVV
jgi:hypothetical protein